VNTEQYFNEYVKNKYHGWDKLPENSGFQKTVSEAFYAGCDYILKQFEEKQPNKTKCKLCNSKTETVFNINFKPTRICESCAKAVFLQQAVWYTKLENDPF
jgi:hypothetical protein